MNRGNEPWIFMVPSARPAHSRRSCSTWWKPVSYTHLDVYKRQAESRPGCPAFRAWRHSCGQGRRNRARRFPMRPAHTAPCRFRLSLIHISFCSIIVLLEFDRDFLPGTGGVQQRCQDVYKRQRLCCQPVHISVQSPYASIVGSSTRK